MNNGQPPYGDPSAWGQQGNQANPGQYPVQQAPYGQPEYVQQPQQGVAGYSQPFQPVETYQQQAHPQQQTYQQQSWQPYQPQQPQQTYQQVTPQPFYGQMNAQQSYQQTGYQQTGYQQQTQQVYPQFNQMGQQVQQQSYTGYSGYYSQPQKKRFEVPFDVIAKVILFGVLPVLFILALVLNVPALKWVFLGGAVAGIILMWMKDVVTPNMRLTTTLVLGVMAVVALVGALNVAPVDSQNDQSSPISGQNVTQQQNQGNVIPPDMATPTLQPTATPAPEDAAEDAVEQLMSFFYFWSINSNEGMLSLTAPSWRNSVEDPASALFVLLLNRTPQDDYEVTSITPGDAMRTATVKVTIDKNDGRATMDRYAFKVIMKKEDGVWYVDPQSLASNEKETATQTVASANTTPTQPPLYTGTPTTILYYNAKGGELYHLDPDCRSVGAKYKPMSQFMFTELDQAPYKELRPCNQCGAPIPDD